LRGFNNEESYGNSMIAVLSDRRKTGCTFGNKAAKPTRKRKFTGLA
jgi:hypothetical protein